MLFFSYLAEKNIFSICRIFRNCITSGKEIIDEIKENKEKEQEFKHLGSQRGLNTMLKIEDLASDREGQEPDTVIISQNMPSYNEF